MPSISIPDLVNLTQSDAEAKLRDAGLTVGTVTKVNNGTAAIGTVTSTSPKSGTAVDSGTAVNLEISTGPAKVKVPDVVGVTRLTALAALRGAGLAVGLVRTAHSDYIPADGVRVRLKT
jgi:serine/threonine-protein kinase